MIQENNVCNSLLNKLEFVVNSLPSTKHTFISDNMQRNVLDIFLLPVLNDFDKCFLLFILTNISLFS